MIWIARIAGLDGGLTFDASKPDGPPRKLVDVGRLKALGWTARIPLEQGLASTWRWFLDHKAEARGVNA